MNSPLQSIYHTDHPGDDIVLFEGPIDIFNLKAAPGKIYLHWNPYPKLQFRVEGVGIDEAYMMRDEDLLRLKLESKNFEARGSMYNLKSGQESELIGIVLQDMELGSDNCLSRIIGHIANYQEYIGETIGTESTSEKGDFLFKSRSGRLILETNEWSVIIDNLDEWKNIQQNLKAQGSFSITNVFELTKKNGDTFEFKEAYEILECLRLFLTFTRGFHVAPLLYTGFDHASKKCWRFWNAPNLTPWQVTSIWTPWHNSDLLSECFSRLCSLYERPSWAQPLNRVIDWFAEANTLKSGVEGAIVHAMIALEMLAWVALYETEDEPPRKFKDWKASNKIRALLKKCDIYSYVPKNEEMADLAELAKQSLLKEQPNGEDLDGPALLVALRNIIVHGYQTKRAKWDRVPIVARMQAWILAMWYLELTILNLIGYGGKYSSRLKKPWAGQYSTLPWISESENE